VAFSLGKQQLNGDLMAFNGLVMVIDDYLCNTNHPDY